ncbi:MAG: ferrous iron transport protein B [Desulfobacteraceae bacterium]|nr:ferrous iron transport protein B [Desulfobacteraceae bacterium]
MRPQKMKIGLAGQPNSGKSTLFNAFTGARQHVANYPGVTVEKKIGWYASNGENVEVVDLPGTYSLTSYSPEEQVARDFILREDPSVVINVMDASNLKRCLFLTFELMEMQAPVVLALNMIDLAEKRGISIDTQKLSGLLGISVVATDMKTGRGKEELLDTISALADSSGASGGIGLDYGEMEPLLRDIESRVLAETPHLPASYPLRWLAVKLMEGDSEVIRLVASAHPSPEDFTADIEQLRVDFESRFDEMPEIHIANRRYQEADRIARSCMSPGQARRLSWSDRIDKVVCHRLMGPVVLVAVIWLLYYLSIVQGYNVTNYTWPILAQIRSWMEVLLPGAGFIEIPIMRAFGLWFVDSINALLNYIPIFFILFALIALLEDSGYMPRMAFIMDRLFSRYGLHGQSTLPMVLGGIYVGGCAVPGVMACKAIPDERSRLATILVIPLLNCLAKVPLYVLLINIYFASHKVWAMFFISTISLLLVLPISKILTLTVLKKRPTSPFVMEMPPYHVPTVRGVLTRAVERVWLFVRKITTIVAAVAVVVFILMRFPGISEERMAHYQEEKHKAVSSFIQDIEDTDYADAIDPDNIMAFIRYWSGYKNARLGAGGGDAAKAVNEKFREKDPELYEIVTRQGKDGMIAYRAARSLERSRKQLLMDMKNEQIHNSFLGWAGKSLEPVTRYAGFNWRVNVALLSALAAKESSVATLGALYESDERGESLEKRMASKETGFTPLHGLSLMLFMVLYPPCLAAAIAVKIQAGGTRWMLFSIGYSMVLALGVAVAVFSGGSALGLSGFQAMWLFYSLALTLTVVMGLVRNRPDFGVV